VEYENDEGGYALIAFARDHPDFDFSNPDNFNDSYIEMMADLTGDEDYEA